MEINNLNAQVIVRDLRFTLILKFSYSPDVFCNLFHIGNENYQLKY